MKYKVITYFDHMEDDVEIFDNKDEAINRLHHLRGVKYRNSRLYKVEMVEVKEVEEWLEMKQLRRLQEKDTYQ